MLIPQFRMVDNSELARGFYLGRWQLWTTGKMRKSSECCLCGRQIDKGTLAYRPMTNANNPMMRAHPECVKKNANSGWESRR